MNWILEHIQLIIVVAGGIAYWLNQRRKAQQEEAEEQRRLAESPRSQMHTPPAADDEAERIRRIQEEIRRKILERLGGGAPSPQPPELPVEEVEEGPAPEPIPAMARTAPKPDAYAQASSADQTISLDQDILERQRQLSDQLRALEVQRSQVVGKAEAFAEKTAAAMAASGTAIRGSLLADLRNPEAARRAIVLREVLGAPVGLR